MSRYVSFAVLIGVIVLLCIIFYRVMAAFVLPLFLATVLVVVFKPVHAWVLDKTKGHKSWSAALTTAIISLAVIVPVGIVGLFAIGEARQLFKGLTSGGIEQNVKRIRRSLQLEVPSATELHALEETVYALDIRNTDEFESAARQLDQIQGAADRLGLALQITKPGQDIPFSAEFDEADMEFWKSFLDSIQKTGELQVALIKVIAEEKQARNTASTEADQKKGANQDPTAADPDKATNKTTGETGDSQPPPDSKELTASYKDALSSISARFDDFKIEFLGGRMQAYFKEFANPTPAEFKKYNEAVINWIKSNFLSLGGRTSQFIFTLIFNGMIMMVAVYFFLLDGPKMIEAFKFLSPLDDRHEQKLIEEFGTVSRAVVVATLAAALAQGILAGIGYYFAGVDAVFLLTMLTTVLALVPFIGAGSVWVPTCLYLYLIEERLFAASMLAIWGAAVVSTIDNLIKPLILHGQSNIHPLFALLSVLGGVSALGPIGILVGPMVVAFLQTMLKILQGELADLDILPAESEQNHADEQAADQDSTDQDDTTEHQPHDREPTEAADTEAEADPTDGSPPKNAP